MSRPGYGVARAYAGHTDSTGPVPLPTSKADMQAIAAPLVGMTGRPHPVALPADDARRLLREGRI